MDDHIQVSVISLAAEMHVLCNLCQRTGGDFHVALNEDHYKELLLKHVPPRVIVQDSSTNQNDNGDLLVMGFPRRLPFNAPSSLCACHGRAIASQASKADSMAPSNGYICPRCSSRICQVPTDCPICGITIIMSTHLARSYHHLFPVPNYEPLPWSEYVQIGGVTNH